MYSYKLYRSHRHLYGMSIKYVSTTGEWDNVSPHSPHVLGIPLRPSCFQVHGPPAVTTWLNCSIKMTIIKTSRSPGPPARQIFVNYCWPGHLQSNEFSIQKEKFRVMIEGAKNELSKKCGCISTCLPAQRALQGCHDPECMVNFKPWMQLHCRIFLVCENQPYTLFIGHDCVFTLIGPCAPHGNRWLSETRRVAHLLRRTVEAL